MICQIKIRLDLFREAALEVESHNFLNSHPINEPLQTYVTKMRLPVFKSKSLS